MPEPTTAIVASSVIGGASSYGAANKAEKATRSGLRQTSGLARQSRLTAENLYGLGMQQGREGMNKAYDFYKQNAQRRYQPYILGNVGAQQMIAQGQQNAQNAILGLPITQLQPQQINPDLSYLGNAPALVQGVSGKQLGDNINGNLPLEQATAINRGAGVNAAGLAGFARGVR